MLFLITLSTILCLGEPLIRIYSFPEYAVLKQIKILDFIENIENLSTFIWYFDICELTPVGLSRVLFQLKATHWFQYVKGFMFSRIPKNNLSSDLTYQEVLRQHLKEYHVPTLTDCDFGHLPPSLPIINGAILDVDYFQGKAKIQFTLK